MIWRWDQKASEMEEAYVAELKQTYGKAYLKCDCSAQDRHLFSRFLNDLPEQKA